MTLTLGGMRRIGETAQPGELGDVAALGVPESSIHTPRLRLTLRGSADRGVHAHEAELQCISVAIAAPDAWEAWLATDGADDLDDPINIEADKAPGRRCAGVEARRQARITEDLAARAVTMLAAEDASVD